MGKRVEESKEFDLGEVNYVTLPKKLNKSVTELGLRLWLPVAFLVT